jgi:hypothetical protein
MVIVVVIIAVVIVGGGYRSLPLTPKQKHSSPRNAECVPKNNSLPAPEIAFRVRNQST